VADKTSPFFRILRHRSSLSVKVVRRILGTGKGTSVGYLPVNGCFAYSNIASQEPPLGLLSIFFARLRGRGTELRLVNTNASNAAASYKRFITMSVE